MAHRTVYLAVFLIAHTTLALGQTHAANDFPPHDHGIVITLEPDAGRTLAEALRTRSPRASSLAVLLRHRYIDESLTVLSRIVDADGPELLPALSAAADSSVWWEDQRRRAEITQRFAAIIEIALTAASRRPRDEGAAITRQALWLRRNISRYSRDAWAADLRTLIEKYGGTPTALLLSQMDFELLDRTIAILGGSLRHVPGSVMATPNQPAGAAETIMKLWNRFFPMRAGHWGGWEFATYPVIRRIEFTNPERTKASVPVTVGYSGGTVLLEKVDGQWRAVDIVNRWIM